MRRIYRVFGTLVLFVPLMLGVTQIGNCGLTQDDFTLIASGGIDTRLNGYPWAMEQFDGDGDGTPEVYVGTVQNPLCLQVWIGADANSSPPPVRWQCRNDLWTPPNMNAYLMASVSPGHVYRGTYDEPNDAWSWQRVFSPSILQNVGFRGARVFNGALYMLGMTITDGVVWKTTDGDNFALASPMGMATGGFGVAGGLRGAQVFDGRLYVANNGICEVYASADPSTDPNSWEQVCSKGFVASGGGTHSASYASGTVESAAAEGITDSSLSLDVGALVGYGVVVTSAADPNIVQTRTVVYNTADTIVVSYAGSGLPFDPIPQPGDAYEVSSTDEPDNTGIWQIAVFDGHLYAACGNPTGPQLWKSDDPRPGNWTRVMADGYGNPNAQGIMSLRPFGNHLYLGTLTYPPAASMGMALEGCEILRVDGDDNIELLVGGTRAAGVVGPNEVAPLSGMDKGFDYPANAYSWYMCEYDGWFYVGTYDYAGQVLDYLEEYAGYPIEYWPEQYLAGLDEWLGADRLRWGGSDLWRTRDGVNWVPVNLDGFGDWDNYGIRNMMATQWGLIVGTGNAIDGFELRLGRSQ
ncbi:MAG: hypothetical protein JXQ73_07675 [Phycisphaerae bacterium]|nr:hypothetical protein [Phycisphaerae bacterium]